MEKCPSRDTNSSLASQEIPHIFLNPKVHYLVHNSIPFVPNLRHKNSVHISHSVPSRSLLTLASLL